MCVYIVGVEVCVYVGVRGEPWYEVWCIDISRPQGGDSSQGGIPPNYDQ